MQTIGFRNQGETSHAEVSDIHRLPVEYWEPKIVTLRQLVARTTGATAYTANDAVGGMLAFPLFEAGRGGVIETVSIVDLTAQKAALILTLFDATITPTTDNAAYDVADADYLKAVATITVASTDYTDSSAAAVGTTKPALYVGMAAGKTTLYGQLETTGTPTYAATNQDLYIIMTVRQF